jgi:release factor glutamine methyltransferase
MSEVVAPVFLAEQARGAAQRQLSRALADAGIAESHIEARLLLCAAAGVDYVALIRDPDVAMGADVAARLNAFAARRLAREPVTRILGHREFWGLELAVVPNVLDPRADSETVVEAVLAALDGQTVRRVLDLGTGSGALLCALLQEFPQATGLGVDLSPVACAAAAQNLMSCGFSARAKIVQGSWSAALPQRFDVVVSNPPYIPSEDIAGLDFEVRAHDPALALDGGADGLKAYRQIAGVLGGLLEPQGIAVLEFGAGQAADVAALMSKAGLNVKSVKRDLGGHERVIVLSL